MRNKAYIDCEYYVISLDQASFAVGGRRVHSPIALGMELRRLGQACREDAVSSDGAVLWKGIEKLNRDPKIGLQLFRWLFPAGSEVARLFAAKQTQRMHFKLRLAPSLSYLHKILWESLTAPATELSALGADRPFARRERIFFSRLASIDGKLNPLLEPRLKVLIAVAAAEPTQDQSAEGLEAVCDRLSAPELRAGLDKIFKDKEKRKVYDIEYLDLPVTPAALRDKLATGGFHALHLIGHGTLGAGAALLLQTEDEAIAPIEGDQLAELIPLNQTLRLVILMACHSAEPIAVDNPTSLASPLIDKGFPATVAMQGEIDTESALAFSESFYGDLRCFGQADRAANSGRQALYAARSMEDRCGALVREAQHWARPVLYTQKSGAVIWKPKEETRRRRRQWVSGVVVLLIFLALIVEAWVTGPLPVIVHGNTPSNPALFSREEQRALGEAFALALSQNDDLEVIDSLPDERPHLEIAIKMQEPLSPTGAPTLSYTCHELGFPQRSAWWPRERARKLCDGNTRAFTLSRESALLEIEDNVRRAFSARWPRLMPLFSKSRARAIKKASIAFLLLQSPQRSGEQERPWRWQPRGASVATQNVYSQILKSRPLDVQPDPRVSLAAQLFVRAQKLSFSSQEDDLKLAKAHLSLLLDNHKSARIPISRIFLQLQLQEIEARTGHLGSAIEKLQRLVGNCDDGAAPKAALPRDERLAACFKRALLLAEYSADHEQIEEARIQALRLVPEGREYRRIRHELEIIGIQNAIIRVSLGTPLADSSISHTYSRLTDRLADDGIRIQPRALPFTDTEPAICPNIVLGSTTPSEPVAAAIDLAFLATLLGTEENRALSSGDSILLTKRCAVDTFHDVIDRVLPALSHGLATSQTIASDARPMEDKIAIYANVARTNLGFLLYQYGASDTHDENGDDNSESFSVDIPSLREALGNLQQSYGFFAGLDLEQQNRWTSSYLDKSRALLAPLLLELGYYGTSHQLAAQIESRHFSASMIQVKTETMRGISPQYVELRQQRLSMGHKYGAYRSMFLFLEAQNRYQKGDIEGTLQDIETLRAELPAEEFSRHLERLYVLLLVEQRRFDEARAALHRLPETMPHSRVLEVEELLDDLAWARFWLAKGRPLEAERKLEAYATASGVEEAGHLSPIGALLPEVFTTVGTIVLHKGDYEAAKTFRRKAREAWADVQRIDLRMAHSLVMNGPAPKDSLPAPSPRTSPSATAPERSFWFVSMELPWTLLDLEIELESALEPSPPADAPIKIEALNQLARRIPTEVEDFPLWTREFDFLRTRLELEKGDRSMLASRLRNICHTHSSIPPTSGRLRYAAAKLARQAKLPVSLCNVV